jgi:hypothetical protein
MNSAGSSTVMSRTRCSEASACLDVSDSRGNLRALGGAGAGASRRADCAWSCRSTPPVAGQLDMVPMHLLNHDMQAARGSRLRAPPGPAEHVGQGGDLAPRACRPAT